ncbi:MAG: hypothetical protein ACK5IJ_11090 [Mangrovibacterium sp.]
MKKQLLSNDRSCFCFEQSPKNLATYLFVVAPSSTRAHAVEQTYKVNKLTELLHGNLKPD